MTGICGNCHQNIKPGSLTTPIMGTEYHSDCLYCTVCTKGLWNRPFIKKKDGTLYCGDSDCSLTTTSLKLPPISDPGHHVRVTPRYNNNQFQSNFDIITNTARSFNTNDNTGISRTPRRKDSEASEHSGRSYEMTKKFTKKMFRLNNDPGKDEEPFIYNKKRHDSTLYLPNIGMDQRNEEDKGGLLHENNGVEMDICDKCEEPFLGGQEKHIFNEKAYHKHCYTCDRCKRELFRMKKTHTDPNQQGMFCEPCFSDMYGPKCQKCLQPVTPYMLSAIYEGKIYHKECFCCPRCKRSFAKEKMYKNGNLIICQNCF